MQAKRASNKSTKHHYDAGGEAQKRHLAIVTHKDPVALGVEDGKLLKARQLLLVQLDVKLRV